MRHYFQLIVFELPTASHPGEYFLLKGSIMTRFKYFIYRFVPLAKLRHKVKRYRLLMKHHIVLIENNKEIPLTWSNIEKIEQFALNVNGVINPTNIIKIELPQNKNCTFNLGFNGTNNKIFIGQNCSGILTIACYDYGNNCSIGSGMGCAGPCWVSLIGNTLKIGENCMLSNNIHIWGDGHSVLDYFSKDVLNKPSSPIVIGDHCWIGERVTLTKSAQIPNDTIVGIASVVSKKFTEEHTVIAGSPAKVVKTGISWHNLSPLRYKKAEEKSPR